MEPRYQIVRTMTAYWIVRMDGDHGQLVEKFTSKLAAEDFAGYLNHMDAITRLAAEDPHHRWTRALVA